MAGAGADSALSGEGPLSLHLQRPPLFLPSVSLGKGPLRQPPAPTPGRPCASSPGRLCRCSGATFQSRPRRLAQLPQSPARGAPHLTSILAREGTGTCRDTRVPLIQQLRLRPSPSRAGQRAQACWQLCHTGPLAGLLWLWVCGPHCAWGWRAGAGGRAGAGFCQVPRGGRRGRARSRRPWLSSGSRPGSECVLSQRWPVLPLGRPGCVPSPGSPGWGQSSSVPGHLTWSPATGPGARTGQRDEDQPADGSSLGQGPRLALVCPTAAGSPDGQRPG